MSFLHQLEAIIHDRQANPVAGSYTVKMLTEGQNAIAQKVGEEAVEVIVAALGQTDERLISESADLLYMLLLLLAKKGLTLADIEAELQRRHTPRSE